MSYFRRKPTDYLLIAGIAIGLLWAVCSPFAGGMIGYSLKVDDTFQQSIENARRKTTYRMNRELIDSLHIEDCTPSEETLTEYRVLMRDEEGEPIKLEAKIQCAEGHTVRKELSL